MNLNKTVFDFKFLGMRVTAAQSVYIGSAILVIVGTALAVILTDLTPLDSLIAGILAMILHWLSDIIHQYGHFLASKYVGKPASGTRLWWILSTTLYPNNEGFLTPQLHIRRALGGPALSGAWLFIFVLLAFAFWSMGGMLQFLLGWTIFINLAIFTLGALMPISIGDLQTDGAILLKYWKQQQSQN